MIGVLCALRFEASFLNNDQVLITGIGAEKAAEGANWLIAQGAKALISWGTAGGLQPDLPPGQLIIPDQILDQQFRIYKTDKQLKNLFICHAKRVICHNPLLQTDKIITSIQEKQKLFQQYQASAIDMESAAIAAQAQQAGIPFLAVRTIVDSANISLPAWLPQVLNKKLYFAWNACIHPESWLSLLNLAWHFPKVRRTLKSTGKLMQKLDLDKSFNRYNN